MKTSTAACAALALSLFVSSCATERQQVLSVDRTAPYAQGAPSHGPQVHLALGTFANRSPYQRGLFQSGTDPLGSQARTLLKTRLTESGRFQVVDRDNLESLAFESDLTGVPSQIVGADVVIAGEVVEFGRRTTGDQQLFGLGGRGKSQVVHAKVALNLIDVATSQVLHAVEGAAEVELANREILGTGGTAGHDGTLNDKALNLALTQAVDQLVLDLDAGRWGAPQR